MNILTALAFGLLINGCTIIGMHLDEVTQSKNNIDADAAFTELGLDIDIQLIKHATTGKSLLTKDKPTGCNNLKGKRKEECIRTSKLITQSIKKHTKPRQQ